MFKGSMKHLLSKALILIVWSVYPPPAPAGINSAVKVAEKTNNTGKTFTNSIGMKFIYIPPGNFIMGSTEYDDEKPPHRVTLTKGFYLQTTEATQGQWKAVMGGNTSWFKNCGDDCPVENVPIHKVEEFIDRLNRLEEGYSYRLPTEAEWEYACRAGTTGKYSYKLGEYAWYEANSGKRTHPVGRKKPNAWGLFDMHGNVWEWSGDRFGGYPASSVTDPTGPVRPAGAPSRRVLRGGSWGYGPAYARCSDRIKYFPAFKFYYVGFRLVRNE